MTDDEIAALGVDIDYDALPPALDAIPVNDNVGSCATCGRDVYRPDGQTTTGRKKRIPKYCNECKTDRKPTATVARRSGSKVDIAAGMTGLYEAIGMAVFTKDPELGVMIIGVDRLNEIAGQTASAQSVAQAAGSAWAHVAANNPAVAAFLQPILNTSVWTDLAVAHAPVVGHVVIKGKAKGWFGRQGAKMKLARWRKVNRRPEAQHAE